MSELQEFIQSHPPPQELKRALAVQMMEQGYTYRDIQAILQVSLGFVSACKQRYAASGVEGLRNQYWGTRGYLSEAQKQELLAWLGQRDDWLLEEVIEHLEHQYGVVYQSLQSYYSLMHEAGLSWKRSHATHPDKDPEQVRQKKRDCGGTPAVAS